MVRRGDEVLVAIAGKTTRLTSIRVGDEELDFAAPPLSVSIAIENDIDIGRGDMLVDPRLAPSVSGRMRAA